MINKKETIKQHAILIALLCLFSLFVHRNWFQEGIDVYSESAYLDKEYISNYISLPYLWQSKEDGGYSNIINLSKYPIWFVCSLLVKILTPRIASFVVYGLPCIFLPGITMYLLAQFLFKRHLVSFVASLVASFNSYQLILQRGGQTCEAIAVSLIPLSLLFLAQLLGRQKIQDAIFGGLSLALVLCFDVRFAYLNIWVCLIFLPFVLFCFRKGWATSIKKKICLIGIFFTIPIAVHSFWIMPLLFHTGMPVFNNYNQPSWVSALSSNKLSHTLCLFHSVWGTLPDAKVIDVIPVFWIIPSFGILGIIFNYKNKKVWYLVLIGTIGIFLAKGSNPPFTNSYQWLFLHLPGFSGFRDAAKLYSFIILAYSPLIGLGVIGLSSKITRKIPMGNYVYGGCLFFVLILLTFPNLKDQMVGLSFQKKEIPSEYKETKQFILENSKGYHTLFYPRMWGFSFYSENYPALTSSTVFNPYEEYFIWLGWKKGLLEESKAFGSSLGPLNVKLIALPLPGDEYANVFIPSLVTSVEYLREQLLKQTGIVETSNYYVLENTLALPRFNFYDNTTIVIGGMGGTLELIKRNPHFFKDHSVVHIETLNDGEVSEVLQQANEVLFYKQKWNDLVLGTLTHQYGIDLWAKANFLGQHIRLHNNTWYRTGVPPHSELVANHGILAYAKNGVIGDNDGNAVLKTDFAVDKDDDYEVWVRAAHAPNMGAVRFSIDENLCYEAFFKKEETYFGWINIGKSFLTSGSHKLMIKSEVGAGWNILDQLVVVKNKLRIETSERIYQTVKNKNITIFDKGKFTKVKLIPEVLHFTENNDSYENKIWYEIKDNNLQCAENKDSLNQSFCGVQDNVEWAKVNPTLYKLKIHSNKPGILFFANSYDPGWALKREGKIVSESILINGRQNGFAIDEAEPGEYVVEYMPQKHVKIGLLISASSLVLILSALFVIWRREKYSFAKH